MELPEKYINSIAESENNLRYLVHKPIIKVEGLNDLKLIIEKISDYLDTVVVTEETLKASKKLVAEVRKVSKNVDDVRKKIKADVLEPIKEFEKKVKEILKLSNDSEEHVRVQIRELEEKERKEKKEKLKEIFDKRAKHYQFTELIDFEKFLKPEHLNKTTPIKKVEQEMVQYFEKRKSDIEALNVLSETNGFTVEEMLTEYSKNEDLSASIKKLNERRKYQRNVLNSIKKDAEKKNTEYIEKAYFEVNAGKDEKFCEMLLKANGVKFRKVSL